MNVELKFVACFVILTIAIPSIVPASSITFAYTLKCKSNDANSTMTHESHLNKAITEDDALGYDAGSFNYLQKGRIEFEDTIQYQNDYNKVKSDYIVIHNMTVYFKGEKGVSKFYADRFYPNNGKISSKKAIGFEDFDQRYSKDSNNFYNIGKNYTSNQISVYAEILMGQAKKNDIYDLAYNATVVKGVVDAREIIGLTNGSGSRMIDWEQKALIKGNITVKNSLMASNLLNEYH